ncbi:MAG: alkaline phosphatase family protein [Candidatus Omnitrophica bacterium]|nr:alkaline phosphatase family protein [Candidatus Omnitrophota bacterium]
MKKKIIILGIDAMDPKITEGLISEGKLPNFSKLKDMGSYSRLKTTVPAESIVCWTSFSTGSNPGGHGIFDFIMRDPKTYIPYLSLNEVKEERWLLFKKLKIENRNKGKNFWEILSEKNVPCQIYFCPNTFPAKPLKGTMLSGMGVPDLYGVIGRFSFYTTKPLLDEDKETRGKVIPVEVKNNSINTFIYGPRMRSGEENKIPLKIRFLSENMIEINLQGGKVILKEKEWSQWQRVYFKTGLFSKTYGIIRFYLGSIEPEFALYMSPINFDPCSSIFPISYPKNYAKKLVKRIGFYYTQGMPHDTWALTEDRFDEEAFLAHVDIILGERKRILIEELKRFKKGVFFFYFDTLDAIQHMFWRYIDKKHPLYEENSKYKEVIFYYYKKIDEILGEVMEMMGEETNLIIFSDHGFGPFRKTVNLNRWLLEEGYLVLKEGFSEGKEFFENVDWTRTRAYALGFGGIYLNKTGREKMGIVKKEEEWVLKKEISKKLGNWHDPKTGERVISKVYLNEEIFSGLYAHEGPDLFVGTNSGYRVSWKTALGIVPQDLIEDNFKKWSGDHLIDPELVPGVIFINKKVELNQPHITDIISNLINNFDKIGQSLIVKL